MAELRPRLSRLERALNSVREGVRDCPGCKGPLLVFHAGRDDDAGDGCEGFCENCGFILRTIEASALARHLGELLGNLKAGSDVRPIGPEGVDGILAEAEEIAVSMMVRHRRR